MNRNLSNQPDTTPSPLYQRLIDEAKGLRSEHGENPEYDRALVELVMRATDMPEEHRHDVMFQVGINPDPSLRPDGGAAILEAHLRRKIRQGLRIVADYQLMSDSEGREWMTAVLQDATDQGQIEGFEVLGSWPGAYGIQHVAFTVDVLVTEAGEFTATQTWDQVKEAASNLLNGPVVPDSDILVRWVSPVQV